ncbi:unnamed protein product [Acanthosepion pharaonis]|uniref:Uncharacterized protein n=1 Tax=Acanthosepion pharaonis TaxID=158019 RepID=A0A812DCW1_ACAPH|nr:unnamed protein product [Sepia pharaonis]
MKILLGNNSLTDKILKQLWLDKLKPHMVQIIASLPEDIDLAKIAEIADRIAGSEPATPVLSANSSTTEPADPISTLTNQISKRYFAADAARENEHSFTPLFLSSRSLHIVLPFLSHSQFLSFSFSSAALRTISFLSTRAFTLSPSNTLQVKSGPSFSKRYTCAFLLPVCSLPSSHFLDNRDVGVDLSSMSEKRKLKSDLPEVRRSVFCFFFLLLLLPSLFLFMSLSDQYSPKTRVFSGLTRS